MVSIPNDKLKGSVHEKVMNRFQVCYYMYICPWDFPGGPAVICSPANAGDVGSTPWAGKIPHATATQLVHHGY